MRRQLVFHMQQLTEGPVEGVVAHRVQCEQLTVRINEAQADIDTA
jgi:hypothetical protein